MSLMEQLQASVSAEKQTVKSLSEGRGEATHKINPAAIQVRPNFNIRKDYGDIEQLARNIAENGIQVPLTVQLEAGQCFVVHGHRRLAATRMAIEQLGAPIMTVPVIFADAKQSLADLTAQMLCTQEGKNYSDLERAEGISRMLKFGWPHSKIAKSLGIQESRVYQLLDVDKLPDPIKQEVANKNISASLAVKAVAEAPTVEIAIEEIAEAVEEVKRTDKANGDKAKGSKNPPKKAKVKPAQLSKSLTGKPTAKAAASKAAGPSTVTQSAREAADKAKTAKVLADRHELIKTLFLRSSLTTHSKGCVVSWKAADFATLLEKLGLKETDFANREEVTG